MTLCGACKSTGGEPSAPPGRAIQTLAVTSRSFPSNGEIPVDCTCDGANRSPALTWSAPPEGTQSFAVVVEDPDAPGGTFTQWIVYGMSADARALPEGVDPVDDRGRIRAERFQAAGLRRALSAVARVPPLQFPRLRAERAAQRRARAQPRRDRRRHGRPRPRDGHPGQAPSLTSLKGGLRRGLGRLREAGRAGRPSRRGGATSLR